MSEGDSPDATPASDAPAPLVREIEIVNKRGLHARASAKFVQLAETFEAEITVTRSGETAGATSIMGLMMLAAGPGSTILLEARGPQAKAALDALEALIASRFGEDE
jgi:phosphocarrier protein